MSQPSQVMKKTKLPASDMVKKRAFSASSLGAESGARTAAMDSRRAARLISAAVSGG